MSEQVQSLVERAVKEASIRRLAGRVVKTSPVSVLTVAVDIAQEVSQKLGISIDRLEHALKKGHPDIVAKAVNAVKPKLDAFKRAGLADLDDVTALRVALRIGKRYTKMAEKVFGLKAEKLVEKHGIKAFTILQGLGDKLLEKTGHKNMFTLVEEYIRNPAARTTIRQHLREVIASANIPSDLKKTLLSMNTDDVFLSIAQIRVATSSRWERLTYALRAAAREAPKVMIQHGTVATVAAMQSLVTAPIAAITRFLPGMDYLYSSVMFHLRPSLETALSIVQQSTQARQNTLSVGMLYELQRRLEEARRQQAQQGEPILGVM